MLWLRDGFGFASAWTVYEQNQLLAVCFGLQAVTKTEKRGRSGAYCGIGHGLR